jgi:hypothetical protein
MVRATVRVPCNAFPSPAMLRGWTVLRDDRVVVTTERLPRNERAPPFGPATLKQASSTVDDLQNLPDDGQHYEVVGVQLFEG